MATITCKDCGSERHGCPKNTLYCKYCRVLADLAYWRVRLRTCQAEHCKKKFAPLNRTDYHCSKHNPGLEQYDGSCILAGALDGASNWRPDPHNGWPAMHGIPICAGCMRDPKKRVLLIGTLTRGRSTRRETNDWSKT